MKNFLWLVLLFVVGCSSPASTQNPPPAQAASTPGAIATLAPAPSLLGNRVDANPALDPPKSIQRDVTYCTVDGVALKLDLYAPPQAVSAAPAAVYVHGGGWSSGDKAGGSVIPFSQLAAQGFWVAAVNYRLAPQSKFPAMIEDVKCAVRFLRANAARLNLDPNRIGAWGGSAGGHLVALLGTTDRSAGFDVGEYADQSSRVQAIVDMFGPADLTLMFPRASAGIVQSVFGSSANSQESARLASPITYATPDDPPFLILQGDKDNVVPLEQSQVMYDRLRALGVPATLVVTNESQKCGFSLAHRTWSN